MEGKWLFLMTLEKGRRVWPVQEHLKEVAGDYQPLCRLIDIYKALL
jgi:hypothetical protein